MKTNDIVLIIIAIIFPPAAVFIITGWGVDLLINVLLTILGYIPGHVHAFWLIYKRIKAEKNYGPHGYKYSGRGRFRSIQKSPVAPPQPDPTIQMPVPQPAAPGK